MSNQATVYVVDDDAAVRASLERLFLLNGLTTRAFASAEEFLSGFDRVGPACLVLDLRMGGMSGLELQQMLRQADVSIPIIFISGHGDVETAVRAMHDGAIDFLTKPFRPQALLEKTIAAIEGDRTRRFADESRAAATASLARLSPRESEVLNGLVAGESAKEIAARLKLSRKTVDIHRSHVMLKLGVDSVASLVRLVLLAQGK